MTIENPEQKGGSLTKDAEDLIHAALKGLRFGSVEITVHDARIVQVERKEKMRPGELHQDKRR